MQGLDPADTRGVGGVEAWGQAAYASPFQWAGACCSSWDQHSTWDPLLSHALDGLYLGNAKPSSPRGPSQLTSISKCAGLPVSIAPQFRSPLASAPGTVQSTSPLASNSGP